MIDEMDPRYYMLDQGQLEVEVMRDRYGLRMSLAILIAGLVILALAAYAHSAVPPQAPPPPQAPVFIDAGPQCEYSAGGCVVKGGEGAARYAAAYAEALRSMQPLVVFMGQPARSIAGMACVRWDDYPGNMGPHVPMLAVGVPDGMGRLDVRYFGGSMSDAGIRIRAA